MKHVHAKPHRQAIKRRTIIELIALGILVFIVLSQIRLIDDSLSAIRSSDVSILLAAAALYWLLPFLTAVSYRLLCDRPVSLPLTTLAHIAGSGPGRVIPGGLGHMSLAILNLRKLGVRAERAIVVSLANNIAGVVINFFVLVLAVVYEPAIYRSVSMRISTETVALLTLAFAIAALLGIWLLRLRAVKLPLKKVGKQTAILFSLLKRSRGRLIGLFAVALLILLGNIVILQFCSRALHMTMTYADATVALSIGVAVGGLLPTPGGLGGVEAGIVLSLTVLGYSPQDSLSVALLYRVITYWQPILPGIVAYTYLRGRNLL